MNNDFKKGFLTGAGGLLGVLSIPVGIYLLYLLYTPTIMSLQKKEYLDWNDCYWDSPNWPDAKECGEKPKRWKWQ